MLIASGFNFLKVYRYLQDSDSTFFWHLNSSEVLFVPSRRRVSFHHLTMTVSRNAMCFVCFVCLSYVKSPRPDHQPTVYSDASSGQIPAPDQSGAWTLADWFYLFQSGWLGLVLSVDDSGRLLTLHHHLAPDDDHDGGWCHRHLEGALEATGLSTARVRHKPRLLSDNGPCYISGELKGWLKTQDIEHTRGAPYHPQTQGKIERYHRSMKNVVKLEHYYYPWELEKAIAEWVEHYNHERYHESLDNVTPSDVYQGRRDDILDQRAIIKSRTMIRRKIQNLRLAS
jgi:hypothetical protein